MSASSPLGLPLHLPPQPTPAPRRCHSESARHAHTTGSSPETSRLATTTPPVPKERRKPAGREGGEEGAQGRGEKVQVGEGRRVPVAAEEEPHPTPPPRKKKKAKLKQQLEEQLQRQLQETSPAAKR